MYSKNFEFSAKLIEAIEKQAKVTISVKKPEGYSPLDLYHETENLLEKFFNLASKWLDHRRSSDERIVVSPDNAAVLQKGGYAGVSILYVYYGLFPRWIKPEEVVKFIEVLPKHYVGKVGVTKEDYGFTTITTLGCELNQTTVWKIIVVTRFLEALENKHDIRKEFRSGILKKFLASQKMPQFFEGLVVNDYYNRPTSEY